MSVGFYVDMTRCTGCRACQVACKDKNRLDVGTTFRNAHSYSVGDFPEVKVYHYSKSCNHCEDPMCLASCPVGAISKLDDGTVYIDKDTCTGCGTCTTSCPYMIPQMLPDGVAGKCDGCYAIRQAGGVNACVAGCPNRALDFGDVEDLKAKYGDDLVSDIAVLPSSSATGANIYIKAKDIATDSDYNEVCW